MFVIIIYILHCQALKSLPQEKVQVATKFGMVKLEGDHYGVRGTPKYVQQCCEASLKQLDIDYIDLYYPHRIDITVPIEDTVSIQTFFFVLLKSSDTTFLY